MTTISELTFRQMYEEAQKPTGASLNPLYGYGPLGEHAWVDWDGNANDNILMLKNSGLSKIGGAAEIIVNGGYIFTFRVMTTNAGWFNEGLNSNWEEQHASISNLQSLDLGQNVIGNWSNSVDVTLVGGNSIEIDVDDEVPNIAKFKFNLPNSSIAKTVKVNDDVWIELVDAIWLDAPVIETTSNLANLYNWTNSANPDENDLSPFSEFTLYGTTSWEGEDLVLDSIPLDGATDGAFSFTVKEGWWVKVRLMNEDGGYFSSMAARIADDSYFTDNEVGGSDPWFEVIIEGGGSLYHDVEGASITPFFLMTADDQIPYTIGKIAENDATLSLISYGQGDPGLIDPPPPTTTDDEKDYWASYEALDLDWALWGTIGILTFLAIFVWVMRRRVND